MDAAKRPPETGKRLAPALIRSGERVVELAALRDPEITRGRLLA